VISPAHSWYRDQRQGQDARRQNADNVKVEVVRSAVSQVLGKDEEPAAEAKK